MKLTLEVFLGYSYEMAYFHPDILIEAILIKKKRVFKNEEEKRKRKISVFYLAML